MTILKPKYKVHWMACVRLSLLSAPDKLLESQTMSTLASLNLKLKNASFSLCFGPPALLLFFCFFNF